MIRLAWALRAEDTAERQIIAQTLADLELAGVDWTAATADAALEGGRKLTEANVSIVCLATTVTLPAYLGADSAWLDPTRVWVMAAAELGATQLRLALNRDASTRNRPSAVRVADQLAALAELAGQQGVRILLETRGEFADPAELWRVLELSNSENLSACLSLTVEHSRSEPVSYRLDRGGSGVRSNTIPVLNLRLRHVHIRATLDPKNLDSGETGIPIERDVAPIFDVGATGVMHHLQGIGYDGCVAITAQQQQLGEMSGALRKIVQPPKSKSAPPKAKK